MDYEIYRQRKFKAWRQKVKKRLPDTAIVFYTAKNNGVHIDYDKEKLLGTVIREINNPSYGILDKMGTAIEPMNRVTLDIVLHIQTEELFAFIKTLK